MLNLEIIGQGSTTTIYRDGNKAVKLYVDSSPNKARNEAQNEAERQQFAFDAGLPVPAVVGVRQLDENNVALDMEYINGKPMFQPKMDKEERKDAINTIAKLQCMVHGVTASEQPKQTDRIAQKIKLTPHLSEPRKSQLLTLLGQLDTNSINLCHGDFHPLNILYDGNKHWIIDWVDSTAGSPLADACRTYLIFKQFMSRQAEIYLRAFCKEAKVNADDVLVWLPIITASRLNDNMDEKSRGWLLDMLGE